MVEQAGHLTKYVAIRGNGEKMSLGSVEIARCPLDKWSIAQDAERFRRMQWNCLSRLPGRFKVTLNRIRQNLIVALYAPRPHPEAQRFKFVGPRQSPFAPGYRHGPFDLFNVK